MKLFGVQVTARDKPSFHRGMQIGGQGTCIIRNASAYDTASGYVYKMLDPPMLLDNAVPRERIWGALEADLERTPDGLRLVKPSGRTSDHALVLLEFRNSTYEPVVSRYVEASLSVQWARDGMSSFFVMVPGDKAVVSRSWKRWTPIGKRSHCHFDVIDWDGSELKCYETTDAEKPRMRKLNWQELPAGEAELQVDAVGTISAVSHSALQDVASVLSLDDASCTEQKLLHAFAILQGIANAGSFHGLKEIKQCLTIAEKLKAKSNAQAAIESLKLGLLLSYSLSAEPSAEAQRLRIELVECLQHLQS